MLAIRHTDAQANNTGFTNAISVSVNISNTVGYLHLSHIGIQVTRGTKDNIGSWSHASITIHMSSCRDTCRVSSVCTRVIHDQRINLIIHEYRTRQLNRPIVHGRMPCLVSCVINPNNTRFGRIVAFPEGAVLKIKPRINNADNHTRSIIRSG